MFEKLLKLTQKEKDEIIDSGLFNTTIQGYTIMAMLQAGFTDEDIAKINFPHLFDSISAYEARKAGQDN